jgi:glycosyltransferase involved in cell wall biosynthesis
MPALLLDVSRLLYRRMTGQLPTGIDRVSLAYVRHYAGRARAMLGWRGLSAALSPADSAEVFDALLAPGPDVARRARRAMSKACLAGCALPRLSGHFLVNTAHYGMDHRWYAGLLRLLGARPVVLVHDLIPITHPQYCRAAEPARHVARMRNALTMARGIICNSRYTLETLTAFAAGARLAMPPALVAPLASALPRSDAAPRPLAEPYFVAVGTIEPRKNHQVLLEAWRALAAERGAHTPKLVLVGQRSWDCAQLIKAIGRPPLAGHVIEAGVCTDAELARWLQHAQALLMPSWIEGYGLPVAEALAAGVPVIASDLAVFREIASAIPEYADPARSSSWLELVRQYAEPQAERRRAQVLRLGGFRPTTWQQHFAAVDAFLERLA